MSKERIKISDALYDIMPSDYQDLVKSATYGKEDRGWKDIGTSKELIEQHSLCAGCPESMAFRYILASLPNPEDTVMVGSTGCTSLVFPMVAVHNIHSLFGNQNAVASGLKRALSVRFPGRVKEHFHLPGPSYRWTHSRIRLPARCKTSSSSAHPAAVLLHCARSSPICRTTWRPRC